MVIATSNRGKLQEIRQLLLDIDINLLSPDDLGLELDIDETGRTYAENAELKARAAAQACRLPALGDDSGLEVEALGGAPGLHTARYAGPRTSDADRYRLLLARLEGVPPEQRAARFRCVVAVATPGGDVAAAEGTVEGRIAYEPAGSNGFGYDPVFYLEEYGCTMAELPDGVKNRISHRARAVQAARPLILQALRG
jgi:XTP/dITP diphosphohydrolase